MALSLSDIHKLELAEDYPKAIDALEERWQADPTDTETVIRLGFNLWYAVAEEIRLKRPLPIDTYAVRFVTLYEQYRDRLKDNADFCWAFGLGMFLCPGFFPGITKDTGSELLGHAMALDPFWRDLSNADFARFAGRGIFEHYYGTTNRPD